MKRKGRKMRERRRNKNNAKEKNGGLDVKKAKGRSRYDDEGWEGERRGIVQGRRGRRNG